MNISLWIRGGGMRSVAYAGFIEGILQTDQYTISRVIGNSGGSIIAAMLALDMPMKSAIDYFEGFNLYTAFLGKNYIHWEKYAHSIFGATDINKTDIPLIIQAYCKDKKKISYFSSGEICKAVVASSALIQAYEWNSHLYLDCNELNNVSLKDFEGNSQEKRVVINASMRKAPYFETFSKYIQLALIDSYSKSLYSKDNCTFVDIPVPTHSLFERKNLAHLFELGYKQGLHFKLNE